MIERAAIDAVILGSHICRLGMACDDRPYVVPLCFGYENDTLYVHSAREGKKIDILQKNSAVCFEFDMDQQVLEADEACRWGMRYRSVIGFGTATILDDPQSKRMALDIIMRHYSDRAHTYSEKALNNTVVIRIDIESVTGKESGFDIAGSAPRVDMVSAGR